MSRLIIVMQFMQHFTLQFVFEGMEESGSEGFDEGLAKIKSKFLHVSLFIILNLRTSCRMLITRASRTTIGSAPISRALRMDCGELD
jgi:hypothetical protein